MEHFCIKLVSRGKSFKLTRDEFALINTKPSLPYFTSLAACGAYADEGGSAYSECWCTKYREMCLRNYDLNIKYFATLDKDAFNFALTSFLSRYHQFKEVFNLNEFSSVEGFYIMILDEYKQAYIGKSKDIKKRILKHWSDTKPFDRTLCPMFAWEKSVFSIDFFRALDTTRIYAWKNMISDGIEAELIRNFPTQFRTNRIGGDITDAINAMNTMTVRPL